MALRLKFLKGLVYETYNTKETNKEHKKEAKADGEETAEEEKEAPVALVNHVDNILHSIFSNVELYYNNQQIYNSNGLYTHNSYIFENIKGAISEHEGFLHCERYDYEEIHDALMEALLSEHFSQGR